MSWKFEVFTEVEKAVNKGFVATLLWGPNVQLGGLVRGDLVERCRKVEYQSRQASSAQVKQLAGKKYKEYSDG